MSLDSDLVEKKEGMQGGRERECWYCPVRKNQFAQFNHRKKLLCLLKYQYQIKIQRQRMYYQIFPSSAQMQQPTTFSQQQPQQIQSGNPAFQQLNQQHNAKEAFNGLLMSGGKIPSSGVLSAAAIGSNNCFQQNQSYYQHEQNASNLIRQHQPNFLTQQSINPQSFQAAQFLQSPLNFQQQQNVVQQHQAQQEAAFVVPTTLMQQSHAQQIPAPSTLSFFAAVPTTAAADQGLQGYLTNNNGHQQIVMIQQDQLFHSSANAPLQLIRQSQGISNFTSANEFQMPQPPQRPAPTASATIFRRGSIGQQSIFGGPSPIITGNNNSTANTTSLTAIIQDAPIQFNDQLQSMNYAQNSYPLLIKNAQQESPLVGTLFCQGGTHNGCEIQHLNSALGVSTAFNIQHQKNSSFNDQQKNIPSLQALAIPNQNLNGGLSMIPQHQQQQPHIQQPQVLNNGTSFPTNFHASQQQDQNILRAPCQAVGFQRPLSKNSVFSGLKDISTRVVKQEHFTVLQTSSNNDNRFQNPQASNANNDVSQMQSYEEKHIEVNEKLKFKEQHHFNPILIDNNQSKIVPDLAASSLENDHSLYHQTTDQDIQAQRHPFEAPTRMQSDTCQRHEVAPTSTSSARAEQNSNANCSSSIHLAQAKCIQTLSSNQQARIPLQEGIKQSNHENQKSKELPPQNEFIKEDHSMTGSSIQRCSLASGAAHQQSSKLHYLQAAAAHSSISATSQNCDSFAASSSNQQATSNHLNENKVDSNIQNGIFQSQDSFAGNSKLNQCSKSDTLAFQRESLNLSSHQSYSSCNQNEKFSQEQRSNDSQNYLNPSHQLNDAHVKEVEANLCAPTVDKYSNQVMQLKQQTGASSSTTAEFHHLNGEDQIRITKTEEFFENPENQSPPKKRVQKQVNKQNAGKLQMNVQIKVCEDFKQKGERNYGENGDYFSQERQMLPPNEVGLKAESEMVLNSQIPTLIKSGGKCSAAEQSCNFSQLLAAREDIQSKKRITQEFSALQQLTTGDLFAMRSQSSSVILVDSRDQLSALGVESSIRSDVLYKTIIRDMRKFFSKDFNTNTMFIKRKRYKCDQYFFLCIKDYLEKRFSEFGERVFNKCDRTGALTPEAEYLDLIFFLGCLLYPKDIELAMGQIEGLYSVKNGIDGENHSLCYKTIHSYLYSFSLEKLNNLVNLKYFAFFFCHYFEQGILRDNRIEKKDSMRKHFKSYTEACNLILNLCQQTLRRCMLNNFVAVTEAPSSPQISGGANPSQNLTHMVENANLLDKLLDVESHHVEEQSEFKRGHADLGIDSVTLNLESNRSNDVVVNSNSLTSSTTIIRLPNYGESIQKVEHSIFGVQSSAYSSLRQPLNFHNVSHIPFQGTYEKQQATAQISYARSVSAPLSAAAASSAAMTTQNALLPLSSQQHPAAQQQIRLQQLGQSSSSTHSKKQLPQKLSQAVSILTVIKPKSLVPAFKIVVNQYAKNTTQSSIKSKRQRELEDSESEEGTADDAEGNSLGRHHNFRQYNGKSSISEKKQNQVSSQAENLPKREIGKDQLENQI